MTSKTLLGWDADMWLFELFLEVIVWYFCVGFLRFAPWSTTAGCILGISIALMWKVIYE